MVSKTGETYSNMPCRRANSFVNAFLVFYVKKVLQILYFTLPLPQSSNSKNSCQNVRNLNLQNKKIKKYLYPAKLQLAKSHNARALP